MDDKQTIISRSVSFKALILARVLPDRGRDSLAYYLSVRVIFTCVWLLVASDAFYIYSRINDNYGFEVVEFGLVCIVSLSGVMWITMFCTKNRHLLIALAQGLSDFTAFGFPPNFEKFMQQLNFYSKIHLFYLTGGALMYFLLFAPLHKRNCDELKQEKNLSEICSLLLPLNAPFVEYQSFGKFPTLQLLNIIIFLSLMYMYMCCGTIVWLNVELVEHIRIRIRHLKLMILRALKSNDREFRRKKFREAIRYHEYICSMSGLADEFFGTELFLHVVLTGAILGISAYLISNGSLETVMIFVGWLNAIIMGSVAGQRLINESLGISDIIYKVDWYNFETVLKKDILFFLLRSKKPMFIRAGNVVINNALIIQILRTAYSYVTFLSSINN